ncbi:MAG: hypothetical protein AAGF98_04645 [Cyanobacteria bacterium P01_H01_bin.153]
MDKVVLSERALGIIAASAERFLGYLYAGVLPFVIVTIEKTSTVKEFVDATGGILAGTICLVIGIGIYTIYYRILGELLIFPFQHILHILLDVVTTKDPGKRSSTIGLLVHYGVPLNRCRSAYDSLKGVLFEGRDASEIQVSHGELHVLYLSSLITLAAFWGIQFFKGNASSLYVVISIVSFISALIADTLQHSREALVFKANQAEVVSLLKERGFIS